MSNINRDELQLAFAHALTVGMTTNAHTLDGNVSSEDVGKLIHTRASGITDGYLAAAAEAKQSGYDSGAD